MLEQTARRKMNEIMEETQSGNVAEELRTQYMSLMIASAAALGIPGVSTPEGHYQHEWEEYQAFSIMVQGVVAQVMLNERLVAGTHSVQLATATKTKIEGQISILRSMIENSNMDAKRRGKLIVQLDEFSAELNRPRMNYAAVAMIATAFLAGVQGVTSTLADAPSAYKTVGTILKWIGQDKEAEEREQERLGAPAPMLPAPEKTVRKPKVAPLSAPSNYADFGWGDHESDDVPF
ncbi:MAG: hypothetical protein J7530_07450 [Novosphingobium sp.]|nr:hypothetical protein [Novosphingobium sp.]